MTIEHPANALTEQLLDPALYANDPFPLYRTLREEAPVAWCASKGFWAVTSHALVNEISTDPGRFRSGGGIITDEIGVIYESPPTMMHTDPPAHTRYRRLVQPSFKPTEVRSLDADVRAMAQRLLGDVPLHESIDFVHRFSVPFPLQVICSLLGADTEQWPRFFDWSEASIPGTGNMTDEERGQHQMEMWEYLITLATDRRASPTSDVVSQLATAEIDGDLLGEPELAMFLIQLLVAGNETTRNSISGGLLALAQHPEQWEQLRNDRSLIPSAVEEILRWTTAVISFMRTATHDTTLGGVALASGDPVLMIYAAANRAPAAFGPTAESFDITRHPNPHVSFGFGTHFCLGASLARLELRIVLEEMLDRYTSFEISGPVELSPSPIIAGIDHAALTFH